MDTAAAPTTPQSPTGTDPRRRHAEVDSPLGRLRVVVDASGALAGVYLPEHSPTPDAAALGAPVGPRALDEDADLRGACAAVAALASDPRAGVSVELADVPGTAFQQAVWAVVAGIGVGETLTYAQVAEAVGRPSAHRAVGRAVGANPRCLVVPCHRVVGSRGAITGYAGGVDLKRWLLAREQDGGPSTDRAQVTPE